MKYFKAYDLPLRILHWSFATLFVSSFVIGKFVDDDSVLYSYHMLSGILMGIIIFFRIVWGLLGSKTSRLKELPLSPAKLKNYFTTLFSSNSPQYLGHNPASSYAMIIMFLITFALLVTGLAMGITGQEGPFEDIHELLAHGFLLVVIFHIGGGIFHQSRHKDGMILSMFTGKKKSLAVEDELKSNHSAVALVLIFLIGLSGFSLIKSFNPTTRYLTLMGTSVYLGEPDEEESHSGYERNEENEEYDEHDEEDD